MNKYLLAPAALLAMEVNELRGMLSPTAALLALLDEATPKAEVPEAWNGQRRRCRGEG